MNDETFDVNQATRNQLLEKAHSLGLDAPNTMSKEALKDLVGKQIGSKVVAGDSPELGKAVEVNMRDLRKQKKVRIRIHESAEHPPRIPVTINGVPYTMKPGVWVDVPEAVVEVLRNAVKTTIIEVEGENGRTQLSKRDGLQFPFEVAGPEQPKAA